MSKIKPFKKIYTQDQDLTRVQEAISDSLAPLSSIKILDSEIIKDIAVSTTPVEVSHGLNRDPSGFIVINRTSNVQVWRTAVPSIAPAKLLKLEASATATVSILIF